MKKILTAFFLSVTLMFAGLLCLNVNAAETTYSYTFAKTVFSANDTKILGDFEWKLSGDGGFWGFDPKKGEQFGSKNDPYTELTLETTSEISNVSKIVVNASTASGATASLVVSVGTPADTKKTLSTTATDYSYEFDPKVSGVISIKITQTSSKALYIKSISITYEPSETYSISFDANGGTFVEGQGTAIENIPNGTKTTVTLPTAADLSSPAYKYSVFKSWTDGENTYAPGEAVEVTAKTTFTAVYEAPEFITVSQALEICGITGTSNTSLEFSVKGVVSKIRYAYSSSANNISVNLSDETSDGTPFIYLYKMKGGADLLEGDEIIVTGYLINYKGNTPEMNEGCTYVKGECANFIETDTKSSLIVTYDEELNPTDVDLRLGGIITTDSYLAGATYGVLVTTGTVDLTAGKTTYATVAEFIAANEGFKNVTCTPAQVATGYQFAWVITDMEGNYNTSLTAVMYMVYDGALYICKPKTTSVKDTASQYITNAVELGLTEEQKTVLGKLVA